MSTTAKQQRPLLPPDEKLWIRYSAHHELPLAGMTSFFIHGLVFGLMALAGVWYLFQRESETNKPPSMDMVQLSGGGDGFEGAGGEAGSPAPHAQTVLTPTTPTNMAEPLPEVGINLKEAPQIELPIPEINSSEI